MLTHPSSLTRLFQAQSQASVKAYAAVLGGDAVVMLGVDASLFLASIKGHTYALAGVRGDMVRCLAGEYAFSWLLARLKQWNPRSQHTLIL